MSVCPTWHMLDTHSKRIYPFTEAFRNLAEATEEFAKHLDICVTSALWQCMWHPSRTRTSRSLSLISRERFKAPANRPNCPTAWRKSYPWRNWREKYFSMEKRREKYFPMEKRREKYFSTHFSMEKLEG